jgi:hypothetical protein
MVISSCMVERQLNGTLIGMKLERQHNFISLKIHWDKGSNIED